MTQYQVVGECAHATVNNPLHGRIRQLLLKGAIVPADAPELKHLLSIGLVAKVDDDETGGLNADGVPAGALTTQVPSGVTTTPVEVESPDPEATEPPSEADVAQAKADADLAQARAAARAKLPEDGSAPHANAGQPVWVEYLAARGYDYDELAKQDKPDLVALAKQQS